jgi:hypothetical protein
VPSGDAKFLIFGHLSEIMPLELLNVFRRLEARGKHETAHRTKQRCGQVFRYAVATAGPGPAHGLFCDQGRHDRPRPDLGTRAWATGNHRQCGGSRPIEATEVFHDIIPKDSPKIPKIIESIPVKRLGRPADVARAVMFFADPLAGFVTGQTLFVCGGTSVGSIAF